MGWWELPNPIPGRLLVGVKKPPQWAACGEVWKKRLDLNQRSPDLQSGPFGQARARFWKLELLRGLEPTLGWLKTSCPDL